MTKSAWELEAEERGYREALLDVFCYLVADEQVFDIDPVRLSLLDAMVEQVTAKNSSRLIPVD